jgi:2,3-bisphosphoglycerate-dependent phosphoglycerate mutase
MTTLILIRHGETRWNRERRVQGHADSALTPEGIAQAEACAVRLTHEGITHVYSSDLGRTRCTAEILNAPLKLPINFDASLRERCYGVGEGRLYAELDIEYPELFSRERMTDENYCLPNGESSAQLRARVIAALTRIAHAHEGGKVLIVTHGGVLGALHRWLNDLPAASPHKIHIPNVGYNRVRAAHGAWVSEVWGDVSHLSHLEGDAFDGVTVGV